MSHRRLASLALAPLSLAAVACSSSSEPPRIVLPDASADAPTAPDAHAASLEVTLTDALHTGRMNHTATSLDDGHVLVVGGETLAGRDPIATLEDYDPATGAWTEVATLDAGRSNHTATRLDDGRVLIVGGGENTSNGIPSGEGVVASAVLYDPATHALTPAAPLHEARGHHAAVRLPSGDVLVVGGASSVDGSLTTLASAERYDVANDVWVEAGTLDASRAMLRVELDDEDAPVVVGGLTISPAGGRPVASVERWVDGAFAPLGGLPDGGCIYHDVLRTSAGELVLVGGLGAGVFFPTLARLAVDADAFASIGTLPSDRNSVAAAAVPGGFLAIGGFLYDTSAHVLDEVLLYRLDDAGASLVTTATLPQGHSGARAVTLANGDVLVVGGFSPLVELDETVLVRVVP